MDLLISLITAVAAGAVSAWLVARQQTGAVRQLLIEQDTKARNALAEAVQAAQAAAARAEDAARRAAIPAPAPAVPAQTPVAATPVATPPAAPAPAPVPAPLAPVAEEITPEILMIISAAVAAFSGAKAKIRRVRLEGFSHGGSAWAQQGRAFVQASHNLPLHR